MRIVVYKQDKQLFQLSLPTVLLINRISIAVLQGKLRNEGINIKAPQLHGLRRVITEYRHNHPEWVLVEAYTANDEYVKIEV